jgi:hypothetical protein
MGLAERRAAKEFENNIYPKLKKQIDEIAGFEVPMEVRWDTLMKEDGYTSSWAEGWPKIYFEPLMLALKNICADDMGKDALKAGLKKIVVQDAKDSYSSWWASWENGILTLDHQFCNLDSIPDRMKIVQDTLEKNL